MQGALIVYFTSNVFYSQYIYRLYWWQTFSFIFQSSGFYFASSEAESPPPSMPAPPPPIMPGDGHAPGHAPQRPIPQVERLIRTHALWYLPKIGRAGAVHLLQNKEPGVSWIFCMILIIIYRHFVPNLLLIVLSRGVVSASSCRLYLGLEHFYIHICICQFFKDGVVMCFIYYML